MSEDAMKFVWLVASEPDEEGVPVVGTLAEYAEEYEKALIYDRWLSPHVLLWTRSGGVESREVSVKKHEPTEDCYLPYEFCVPHTKECVTRLVDGAA